MLKLSSAVAVLLAAANTTYATEYSLEYDIKADYRYDSNFGLNSNNEIDVHGVKLRLPAELKLQDARYSASLEGELATSKYDESGYNSDDQKLFANGEYKTEHTVFQGVIGIDRASDTETAFLDTGRVDATADRVERSKAGGVIQYSLSEKNVVSLSAQVANTDYDDDSPNVDNDYVSGFVALTHQLTESTSLQVQGTASRFENDALLEIESDSLGAQVGAASDLTERLNVSVMAGYTDIESEYSTDAGIFTPDDDSSSGWVMDSSLKYAGERSQVSARFNRRSSTSGDGYLIVSSRLNLDYDYDLTERSQFGFGLVGGNSSAVDDRIQNDRDYAQAVFEYRYRLSELWTVSGTYRYRYQDRERERSDADSNTVSASIAYTPRAFTWSR